MWSQRIREAKEVRTMGSTSRAVAGAKDSDLRNCGCQILDDDLRAKWMRRKLLSDAASNGR